MKITIITPSYNQGQFIEETILSVLNQSYQDVEHIVVDGGSTDNTLEILKKYPSVRWVSEKDEGQSDALRKGLEMSTGDIIGWINSDDYLEKGALEYVGEFFNNSDAGWLIGNISFVFTPGGKVNSDKSLKITKKSLLSNPDILRQQGTFFRKQMLLDAGGFDKKYHMTMDLDLWFRLLRISEPVMVDENLAYFRVHEDQKTSGRFVREQLKEMLDIFDKNGSSSLLKLKLRFRKFKCEYQIKLASYLKRKK